MVTQMSSTDDYKPLSASDSEGIVLFLEGVEGPASSMR